MDQKANLLKRLNDKTATVAVLGLGYVGLPLAVAFAEAGYKVIGIEPMASKVDSLNQGKSYILDVSSETVARLSKAGKLEATSDFSALKKVDAVSICVPTPLRKTGDPDLSFIVSANEELAKYIHPGMVIVLEFNLVPRHDA